VPAGCLKAERAVTAQCPGGKYVSGDIDYVFGYEHAEGKAQFESNIIVVKAKKKSTGELPITLTRPDRSVVQQQKTHVSTFRLTFYRPVLERFYRQGGPYPPIYSICLFINDGTDFCRVV
jgi:hypothetical protein